MRWIALSALRTNRADCNKVLSLDEVRSYFSEEKCDTQTKKFYLLHFGLLMTVAARGTEAVAR